MFERSLWRDPMAWSRSLLGTRRRFFVFIAATVFNGVVLILMEYLTLTVYARQYREHGESFELLARYLAIGLGVFIAMSAIYIPLVLATALCGVVRARDVTDLPTESQRMSEEAFVDEVEKVIVPREQDPEREG